MAYFMNISCLYRGVYIIEELKFRYRILIGSSKYLINYFILFGEEENDLVL